MELVQKEIVNIEASLEGYYEYWSYSLKEYYEYWSYSLKGYYEYWSYSLE